jgi:hypothetical protein
MQSKGDYQHHAKTGKSRLWLKFEPSVRAVKHTERRVRLTFRGDR